MTDPSEAAALDTTDHQVVFVEPISSHTPQFPEIEAKAALLLERPEAYNPHFHVIRDKLDRVASEGRFFVNGGVLENLGIDKAPVTWASIYASCNIQADDEVDSFSPFEADGAINLFGTKGSPHPAICPHLTLDELTENINLFQAMVREEQDLPAYHLLSVTELARLAGTTVTSSFKEDSMILHFIRRSGELSPEAMAQTDSVIDIIGNAADGSIVSVERPEDGNIAAIVTISNKDLYLSKGAVYVFASRTNVESYSPPEAALHLTFEVAGQTMVLQMGFEGQLDIFRILQPHLSKVDGAAVVLEMAFNRAFEGEELLSDLIIEALKALALGAQHDTVNRTTAVKGTAGATILIAERTIAFLETLTETKQIDEKRLEEILQGLNTMLAKLRLISADADEIVEIAKYLTNLAISAQELGKLRAIKLLEQINTLIKGMPLRMARLLDLPDNHKGRVDMALLTEIPEDAEALEFAGGTLMALSNLLINSAEASRIQGVFDKIDLEKDLETKLKVRMIVIPETLAGRTFYRVIVADNGREQIPEAQIHKMLALNMEPIRSTTGGTGSGFKIIAFVLRSATGLDPKEYDDIVTLTNGIPQEFLDRIPVTFHEEIEDLTGACVSFLVPAAQTDFP